VGEREHRRAFSPAPLGGITLRNRVIKAATYEGMCPEGIPSPALTKHHRDLADGGVGMTTVAYCAVSPDGRTFANQMHMHDALVPHLAKLTASVHAGGAAVSLQLGHCGAFSRNRELPRRRSLGPSFALNAFGLMEGLPFAHAMSEADIATTVDDFAAAARGAVASGFDAVELHLGHGYLLSQFLCPAVNRRRDRYGGSLENRLRFPLAVLRRVREEVGSRFPILAKTNLRDGFRGGLELEDAVGVAQALEADGIDAIVLSGGFTSRTPFYLFRGEAPLAQMIEVEKSRPQRLALRLFGPHIIRSHPFQEMFFLEEARAVRGAVKAPLALIGGIVSRANIEQAMADGFDFVVMGRALINDPRLVGRIARGETERSACVPCNQCVAEMDRPGGVRCVRNPG